MHESMPAVPRARTASGALLGVVLAATLLPAWWFALTDVRDDGGAAFTWVLALAVFATASGGYALVAARHGRRVVAALAFLGAAVAPTFFFYLGNVACVCVAAWLLATRARRFDETPPRRG